MVEVSDKYLENTLKSLKEIRHLVCTTHGTEVLDKVIKNTKYYIDKKNE